jgi:holliday junction DNA helicase RuvA
MICGLYYTTLVVEKHVATVETSSGVVYEVQTSMADIQWYNGNFNPPTKNNFLHIYHHMNERGQWLYGFETPEIKNLFKDLIDVEGIGCSKAIKILSSMEPEKVLLHIADGDVDALAGAEGIGKKSAEKIIQTLKPKYESSSASRDLGTLGVNTIIAGAPGRWNASPELRDKFEEMQSTAIMGLIKLGYQKKQAVSVISKIDYQPFMQLNDFNYAYDFNDIRDSVIKIAIHKLNSGVF